MQTNSLQDLRALKTGSRANKCLGPRATASFRSEPSLDSLAGSSRSVRGLRLRLRRAPLRSLISAPAAAASQLARGKIQTAAPTAPLGNEGDSGSGYAVR